MSLTPGTRLGAYEIQSVLGAGGMGEVYRARDTKLDRDVALKVIQDGFVGDRERQARFQREAQLLASLNHPHIGAIYGIEETDGTTALVLELVEGPTLADRIAEGPVPLDEALPIARAYRLGRWPRRTDPLDPYRRRRRPPDVDSDRPALARRRHPPGTAGSLSRSP